MKIFLVVAIVVIFFLPINFKIICLNEEKYDSLKINIMLFFNLIKISHTIQLNGAMSNILEKYKHEKDSGLKYSLVKSIFEKITIKDFSLMIQIGIEDVLMTAFLTTFISTLLGLTFSFLNKTKSIKVKKFNIIPSYNLLKFNIIFSCIISTRITNIIIVLVNFLIRKHIKGSDF